MASAYRGFLVGGLTAQSITSDLAIDDKVITQPKLLRCLRTEDSDWVDKLFVVTLAHRDDDSFNHDKRKSYFH
jgi:hypothetical protein